MRKIIFLLTILLLLSVESKAAEQWSKTDLALAGAFIVGQAINYAQTNEVLNNPHQWYEMNPLMPARNTGELIAWKLGSSLALLGVAHFLPSHWRKWLLVSGNIVVWGFIAHDYGAGVSFKW